MNLEFSVLVFYLLGIGIDDVQAGSTVPSVMYQWNTVDYEWIDDTMRNEYIAKNKYIPEHNGIKGIRVYKDKVYVTVPRLYPGVPSTLNVLTDTADDRAAWLRPYPNWAWQTEGDCNVLQSVQGIEIDPNTGYMWILDIGYKAQYNVSVKPLDACPAKLVMYDIEEDQEINRYIFPQYVVGRGSFYLNDIVLDYKNGSAAFAYITDNMDYKLIVYDYMRNESRFLAHPSMEPETEITKTNRSMNVPRGINGIAISLDLGYVYYSRLGDVFLHKIPTEILRNYESDIVVFSGAVRRLGDKVPQGDAMMLSSNNNLYFSALGSNSVYKWDVSKNVDLVPNEKKVQTVVAMDPRMEWVNALALDEKGYLWFTSNKMSKFATGSSNFLQFPNYFVWRIYVNDYTYLDFTQATSGVDGSDVLFSFHKSMIHILAMVCISLCVSN